MTEVNGYKNQETWIVYFWMFNYMLEHFKDEYHDGADIHMDDIKELVQDQFEKDTNVRDGLVNDLLGRALDQVDWRQLETALNDRLKENYELTEEVGGDYE